MTILTSSMQDRSRKRDIVSRVCAALIGGYFAASASSMLLARVVPLPKDGATATAILSTPILYLVAIIWAFSAPSPSRAWVILVVVALIAGGLTWCLVIVGGRS